MESVKRAKERFRQYPVLLGKCAREASVYAQCILKKDSVSQNDCKVEFKLFKNCLQKTAATMKTRI